MRWNRYQMHIHKDIVEYACWEGTTTILWINYVLQLHENCCAPASTSANFSLRYWLVKGPRKTLKSAGNEPMCPPSFLPLKRMYYSCLCARLSEKILCILTFRLIIHLRIYVLSEHKTRSTITIIEYFSWSIVFNIESYVRINVKYFDGCY